MTDPQLGPATDSPDARKARGAFFTPEELCRYIATWAIRSRDDVVLEPSCGEAAFLVASAHRLIELGGRPDVLTQLFGVDLHRTSVGRARRAARKCGVKTHLRTADFFDYTSKQKFQAIIGNPPYVRYQGFTGEARSKSRVAAFAQGVKLSALASSWAAFVIHASSFLADEGRLGLVLPAELLAVNYAAPVRSFLLKRFSRVRLVLFEERVFPGVTEEVVLLLAEGRGGTDHFEVTQVQNAADLAGSDGEGRQWSPRAAEDKWVTALLPPKAGSIYDALASDAQCFQPLIEWGDPTLGMVTGNNSFFALTEEKRESLSLTDSELVRISPPGSRHLRGISFESADWRRMKKDGQQVYLFRPPEEPTAAAARYIELGEAQTVQTAFKCRVRTPWWRVPLVAIPDLFFTYMNSDAPRLVANRARVGYLNSVHGLVLPKHLRKIGMNLLPLAMLNSLSLLGAELIGRSYGGGILKLEPKEADLLPVPSIELLASVPESFAEATTVAAALLCDGRLEEVVELVDEVLLRDHAGISADKLTRLRQARQVLRSRRVARMGS
jgi:adenine-specific DNA-methyltransferase